MLDLKIKFPIWVINSDNIWEQDGIIFIDEKVLDDRNQKGDTIGKRRLQTPLKNLFNLKFQIDDYIGLIKHRGKNYIDSSGKHIYYEKTKYTELASYFPNFPINRPPPKYYLIEILNSLRHDRLSSIIENLLDLKNS